MKKAVVVAGALLLGSGTVMADQKLAVEQDNFMRSIGKAVYVTMLKMSKGDIPYDQAAVARTASGSWTATSNAASRCRAPARAAHTCCSP